MGHHAAMGMNEPRTHNMVNSQHVITVLSKKDHTQPSTCDVIPLI